MKVIAVANAAGSAGKTTTVVTIAALLATSQRVLVVDLDAQANSTRWLGTDPTTVELSVGDVLLYRAETPDAVVETNTPGVQLLPATRRLDSDVLKLRDEIGAEMRLKAALADVDVDVVLIDCPGSLGMATVAAFVAADSIVTVTQPTLKELEGISETITTVRSVARTYARPSLTLNAIVPCIVPPKSSGRLYGEAMDLLHSTYEGLVTPSVRRSVRAAESYSNAEPLPTFAPRDLVTEDYRSVADDLRDRGVL